MKTSEFYYNLPKVLIAQEPVRPRDHSRLMVIDKNKQTVEDRHFYDILDYLKPGDLLVYNNSKVFRARLFGKLISLKNEDLFDHQKPIEIFLIRPKENEGVWQVLAKPGRHVRLGTRIFFAQDFYCDVMVKKPDGTILVQFPYTDEQVRAKANKCGQIPVPPYIDITKKYKAGSKKLATDYQTVYAKYEGSVAAPTAGFHFTPELLQKLKAKGIESAEITLHVGLGTFQPVKTEKVEEHKIHSEGVELTQDNADKINLAKKQGQRIIAVGTTTVRTLEGLAHLAGYADKRFEPFKGDIDIFITPGFDFRVIDAMITNFHLPKSTLLMLVSAFVGDKNFVLDCYKKAVEKKYRFYSFGDAMFIK